MRHAAPITSIVTKFGLLQPAFEASVSGIRIKVKATQMSARPKASISNQSVLMISQADSPLKGDSGSIPRKAALRWLTMSASASGKNATGNTTDQIP